MLVPQTSQYSCCATEVGAPGALAATKEIYNAEGIGKEQATIKAFEFDYSVKYPKAVAKIVDDIDVLLEFYQGSRSRAAGLAMAYKLTDAAQVRWLALNAPQFGCACARRGPCSTRETP